MGMFEMQQNNIPFLSQEINDTVDTVHEYRSRMFEDLPLPAYR